MISDEQLAEVMRMMHKPKGFGSYPPQSVKWGLRAVAKIIDLSKETELVALRAENERLKRFIGNRVMENG